MHSNIVAMCISNIIDCNSINYKFMTKEDILTIKNDIKAFKRVRRVVRELIVNFPEDANELCHQEEFFQLSNARIFLDKTIIRLENLLNKTQ